MTGAHRDPGGTGSTVTVRGDVLARWTGRDHGDLRPHPGDGGAVGTLGRLAGGRAVWWLTQVHGDGIVTVAPGAPVGAGDPGDGLVSRDRGAAVVVLTADCASIALGSDEGVFAAVHAGWRGLAAGVVGASIGAMRQAGAVGISAALGPCIHPECYEFSEEDLDGVAALFGDGVRGRTSAGRPALDLPAAVRSAVERAGVELVPGVDACTACEGSYFSHRARGDLGRQALVVWRGEGDG